MFKSINNDFEYTIINKKIDDFNIWNLKNNFVCIKIDDNNYILNYENVKFLFNFINKNLSVVYHYNKISNKLIDIVSIINNFNKKNNKKNSLFYLEKINNQFKKIYDYDTNKELLNNLIEKYGYGILLHSKSIFKLIEEFEKFDDDEVYISLEDDDIFEISLNLYDTKNKYISDLINEDKIDSIEVELKVDINKLPDIAFDFKFKNVILNEDVSNKLKNINSLHKIINMIVKIIKKNDNIKQVIFDDQCGDLFFEELKNSDDDEDSDNEDKDSDNEDEDKDSDNEDKNSDNEDEDKDSDEDLI